MFPLLHYLPLFLALLPSPSHQQPPPIPSYDDLHRLLDFKNGIWIDPSGLIFNTWIAATTDQAPTSTTTCPTAWHGVTCDSTSTNVVSIDLDGLALFGEIDLATIAGMTSLQNLTLSGNDLTGAIPASLASAVSLRRLDLSRNRFHGAIPDQVSSLWNLNYFNFSFNNFTGEFPAGFQEQQQLRVIDVRSNSLSGDAGVVMAMMRNTEYVDLSGNLFSGELSMLPHEVSGLVNTLRYLDLSSNKLGGRFFQSETIQLFKNLVVLDVSHNRLSGVLPSFALSYGLRVFWARDNLFFGTLPEELFVISAPVVNLDLSRNGFTGPVPNIESTSLMVLNLSSNALSGPLPSKIGSCVIVDFSENILSGDLLPMQSWGVSLEFLDLSSNDLSGNFPKQIYQMGALTYIKIRNNSLEGSLPPAFGEFRNLTVIDLSMNRLTGFLLPGLFTSVSLATLNLRGNLFNGTIPFQVPQHSRSPTLYPEMQMEFLDLSVNSLSGPLLPSVVSLRKLKLLDLGKNWLSGKIPSEIGKLEHLELLDLALNEFEGVIPNISQSSLKVLNVTHNNLSGPIPRSMMRFPDDSFHPGNALLGTSGSPHETHDGGGGGGGGGGNSGSSGVIANAGQEHHPNPGIQVAVIVGCIGLLALVFIIVMAAYKIRSQQLQFKEQITSRELKLGNFSSKFFRSPRKSIKTASTGFSYDPLVNSPSVSRCVSLRRGTVSDTVESELSFSRYFEASSEIVNLGMPDSIQPSDRPSSPLGIDPFVSEQQLVLEVHSPERPLGELHLLNDSMVFTVEDLTRAPAEALGRSGHGTSYKATLNGGHVLTVKCLRAGLLKKKKEFAKEIKRIGAIKHPNITSLKSYYWGPRDIERLIVSDFVFGDSLALRLHEATPRKFPLLTLEQRLQVAIDVARCLCFLHQDKGLPHGNLKPTNILLCGTSLTAQLTDYGIHNLITSSGSAELMLNFGALGYRAPELATSPKPLPSYKADVYAFGVILMELLTKRSAGDIISGQPGEVDLTDWVKKCSRKGKSEECFDKDIAMEAPHVTRELLAISLRCILPVNERPNIKTILEDLLSIVI